MLLPVVLALDWIILELHGIYSIPSEQPRRKDYSSAVSDHLLPLAGIRGCSAAEMPEVPKGQGLGRLTRSSFFVVEFMDLLDNADNPLPFRGKRVNCSWGRLVELLFVE